MRKPLFFLLLFFIFSNVFAQLDRKHWFAPMVDRTGNPAQFQKLYFSTNRTSPFAVRIFNNNILIGTVNVSKGNPQTFDVLRSYIITTQQSDLFTPITKGLYVEGDFPFYANLRFSVYNHAEIITSKGIPSTGTTFYTAMAPITVQNPILNFQTSILATENNTSVTVSGYSPHVIFSNGTTGATNPSITFTLNKGQSYIIDGLGSLVQNADSFIGAKIVSTKPINVTNGNFNGQYAGNYPTASDILMDQSIPINYLGNQFALVKGNGDVGTNTEQALIVATQDNTEIFLNGSGTSIATINEGEYYLVTDTNYQLQGSFHYNLYIVTSKNAYVYQLLAGVNGATTVATGGFNFIPALNCYLPKQINELGLIDENQVFSGGNPSGILNNPTKLNLVTETGANVLVNGVAPLAINGPFPMTGTSNWVTYGIPNVSGNITITSDKTITAGINAGSDAVGYGGFFAGFPTDPLIITSGGNCIPGITLTVDPVIYDTYQWYLNGSPIAATGSSFTPTIPGNYSVSLTMGSCAPLVTNVLKVEKCLVNTSQTFNVCDQVSMSPSFSSVSIPQNIDLSTLSIMSNPSFGVVSINSATGEITYIANNPGVAVTDTFVYTFCGDHPEFPECETVTVTINVQQVTADDDTIYACNANGFGVFDLSSADVSTQPSVNIEYYPTLVDAQNQNVAAQITNISNYNAANGTKVYAVVITPLGCKDIAEVTLQLFPLATVVNNFSAVFCDTNFDGQAEVTLSTITPQVLPNANYFTVTYYDNLADANAGNANTLPNNFNIAADTTIYIRVDSPDGCQSVIEPINVLFGSKIPLNIRSVFQELCDDDFDGELVVNLNNYIDLFTNDPSVTATFYSTINDAENAINSIPASVNLIGIQQFFIRFESANACPNTAEITFTIKIPKASTLLADQLICLNEKISLDAGDDFDSYLWNTGETTQSIIAGVGDYWVDLTHNGCVYRQYVVIGASDLPEITNIDINQGTVTITAVGGTPPYEYSLDGFTWQTVNTFYGLSNGSYTVYVRDKNACEVVKKDFIIIKLINAITPNDDGINDVINYSFLLPKKDAVFRVFDRYNAEVFRGTTANRFTWDGKISKSRPVPTGTYWYILQWSEPDSGIRLNYTSYLLIKNRNDNFFDDH